MRGINRVQIAGNISNNPDIRFTANKTKVAYIRIAANYSAAVTGEDGKRNFVDRADFIPVVLYGNRAEIVEKYCKKGSQIYVDGVIKINDYDSKKTGAHVWKTLIIATNVILLGKKDSTVEAETATQNMPTEPDYEIEAEAISAAAENYAQYGEDAVDVPF